MHPTGSERACARAGTLHRRRPLGAACRSAALPVIHASSLRVPDLLHGMSYTERRAVRLPRRSNLRCTAAPCTSSRQTRAGPPWGALANARSKAESVSFLRAYTDLGLALFALHTRQLGGPGDIVREPADVPPPVGKRGPQRVKVDLDTIESPASSPMAPWSRTPCPAAAALRDDGYSQRSLTTPRPNAPPPGGIRIPPTPAGYCRGSSCW